VSRAKSIGPQLAILALEIAEAVKGNAVPLNVKIDAFRHLSQYFVSTARAAKHIAEEPDEDSIVSLKERIAKSNTKRIA
jgi:hypothetical protein